MTYNKLKEEVTALGFDTEIENEEALLFSVNRSLMQIHSELAPNAIYETYAKKIRESFFCDALHVRSEDITLSVSGKSLSFKATGVGNLNIKDKNGERSVSFSSGETVRLFIADEATLGFISDSAYTVFDLVVYGEDFGGKAEDIPSYSVFNSYDLLALRDDFLSFAALPSDGSGKKIFGAYLRDGKMFIPKSFSGKITLEYKRRPKEALGHDEEELDLPYGAEHLLPLLVAYYVWLDDDEEKAERYLSLFREGMAEIKLYAKRNLDARYENVTGWI